MNADSKGRDERPFFVCPFYVPRGTVWELKTGGDSARSQDVEASATGGQRPGTAIRQ